MKIYHLAPVLAIYVSSQPVHRQDCAPNLLVKYNTELFTSVGALAADQVKANYIQVTGLYDCILSPNVCTYYEDNQGNIRQCDLGTYDQ